MKLKKLFTILLAVAMLCAAVLVSQAGSASVSYSAASITHQYIFPNLTRSSGTTWSSVKDACTSSTYIDPDGYSRIGAHYSTVLSSDGHPVSNQKTVSNASTVTVSSSELNTGIYIANNYTALKVKISNPQYGNSNGWYVKTSGTFTANFS
jgi:hypothetical protein